MTKASDNDYPSVLFTEGTTPSSPSASHLRLFVRSSDHVLCTVNSSGTVVPYTSGGITDPMTTRGDIIVRNSSNATARLAVGSANKFLHTNGTDPAWAAVLPADLDVTADNTTADATTGHHGLLPKLGGGTTNFLRADGSWNAPAGGGGVSSGASFPGSPSTNDLYQRTDINNWIFAYDGTRWRTVHSILVPLGGTDPNVANTSSAANIGRATPPYKGTYTLWLIRAEYFFLLAGTNTGSAYWTIKLNWAPSDDSGDTQLGSTVDTSADSANTNGFKTTTIGAVLSTSATMLKLRIDKVGGASGFIGNGVLHAQIVAT